MTNERIEAGSARYEYGFKDDGEGCNGDGDDGVVAGNQGHTKRPLAGFCAIKLLSATGLSNA